MIRISVRDTVVMTLFTLVLVNGLAYLISLVLGISFLTLFSNAWILFIGYPIAHGIIQSRINRKGVLTIRDFDDFDSILLEIEYIAGRINYKLTKEAGGKIRFNRKSKFGRFLNRIFKEDFTMTSKDNSIKVYGKRNTLRRIEKRLKKLEESERNID